jgi:hypothetical protein
MCPNSHVSIGSSANVCLCILRLLFSAGLLIVYVSLCMVRYCEPYKGKHMLPVVNCKCFLCIHRYVLFAFIAFAVFPVGFPQMFPWYVSVYMFPSVLVAAATNTKGNMFSLCFSSRPLSLSMMTSSRVGRPCSASMFIYVHLVFTASSLTLFRKTENCLPWCFSYGF